MRNPIKGSLIKLNKIEIIKNIYFILKKYGFYKDIDFNVRILKYYDPFFKDDFYSIIFMDDTWKKKELIKISDYINAEYFNWTYKTVFTKDFFDKVIIYSNEKIGYIFKEKIIISDIDDYRDISFNQEELKNQELFNYVSNKINDLFEYYIL